MCMLGKENRPLGFIDKEKQEINIISRKVEKGLSGKESCS